MSQSGGGGWGGVNLERAVRAVRDLVEAAADLPVGILDRLAMIGRAVRVSIEASPMDLVWLAAHRAADVDWEELLVEGGEEFAARVADRDWRGLQLWEASSEDIAGAWAVVTIEATARAFRPLLEPDMVQILHTPWQVATMT